MHFSGSSFKKSPAAADEEGVASEDDFLVAVGHVPAYAVLGVAGRVERFYCDTLTNLERLFMFRRLCYSFTIFPPNDLEAFELVEDLLVAAGVVPVVVCVDDGSEVDFSAINRFFQDGRYLGRVGRVDDHGIVCLVVFHEVGVVVAGAGPHGDGLDMHGAREGEAGG